MIARVSVAWPPPLRWHVARDTMTTQAGADFDDDGRAGLCAHNMRARPRHADAGRAEQAAGRAMALAALLAATILLRYDRLFKEAIDERYRHDMTHQRRTAHLMRNDFFSVYTKMPKDVLISEQDAEAAEAF